MLDVTNPQLADVAPLLGLRAPRAKPLNARTLDALPVGVRVWDDQINYLTEALADGRGAYSLPASLRTRFTEQRDALIRARDWLQSKIDAKETDHA